ncbi:MAG TPA: hypothetical protein VH062_17285 [Polyangiaceae bacterium]|nr:hypothetical protein [Polyangiaceae bacterium]
MSSPRRAVFGLVLSVVSTGLVGCGADSSGSSSDAGVGGAGGASGGGASGSRATGGSATGGGATGGGASAGGGAATGGAASCPPECFRAYQCVTACGQTPKSYGCCPCPAGTIDALTCGASMSDAGAISCDTRSVLCKRVAPTCAAGEVPSVVGECYGPCVKIDTCACGTADECPNADEYTCHLSQKRCGPYVI